MLNLHRDKKSEGVNRGEMRRSLVTTGRMVMMRSIAISEIKKKRKRKKKWTCVMKQYRRQYRHTVSYTISTKYEVHKK